LEVDEDPNADETDNDVDEVDLVSNALPTMPSCKETKAK
jgi:hypothetical protein